MSQRYKGAVISATPPTTTGGNSGTAPGIWTLQQQMQAQNGGVWPPQPIWYVEDVFSTYLYTGNASTQTITNGIDLSGKGGMVWLKSRNEANTGTIYDTLRGPNTILYPQYTNGNSTLASSLTAFTSSGFTLGNMENTNYNTTVTAASWTFRKQAKFFDVVTYTGTGSAQTINHNLGSVPGCMIIKRTDSSASWGVYHRSLQTTPGFENKGIVYLNLTNAVSYGSSPWSNTAPTATQFTVGFAAETNASGGTYVAYLFAHNAGGFGASGTDNVISCGSFTTDASGNASVNLGYEPQWVMMKRSDAAGSWLMFDNMRGMSVNTSNGDQILFANLSDAETSVDWIDPTSTGFNPKNIATSATYIYIAIRRGPMKTPTSGTSVYEGTAFSGNGATNRTIGSSLTADLVMLMDRTANSAGWTSYAQYMFDRLRGEDVSLATSNSNAEVAGWANTYFNLDQQIGWSNGSNASYTNNSGTNYVSQTFRRAPSFMDVVCYTGNGTTGASWNHNLGVAPELIIVKQRSTSSGTRNWIVYASPLGINKYLYLNLSDGEFTTTGAWYATPTSSVFYTGNYAEQNESGSTYVAYLFASCPGVSKVGTYTGTGAVQTINCGFAARFVMIKRTDTGGYGWLVWDTARGMVAGTDPILVLNSTIAENNTSNTVYTNASGFQIVTTTALGINANGGKYIYLAIA